MRQLRKLNRRSFLGRVAGGAMAGGALVAIGRGAGAHPLSDNDSSDPGGRGRSTAPWPHSDVDQGPASDPAGRAGRLGHYSDTDRGQGADPAGHGRRYTDSDRGSGSDPANQRRPLSDSDRGAGSDPAGRGRRPPRR